MILFNFIISSTLIFVNGVPLIDYLKDNPREKDHFNYLILAEMWPQTLCYNWRLASSKNTCKLPGKKVWTIHGFWPTVDQITGPNYCSDKWELDFDSLKEIQNELDSKWIDVKNNTDKHRFLKYEWAKHGTCALSHPKLNNEYKYFNKTLEIFNAYDVTKIFTEAGFHAGGKYFLQDLVDSIESSTKKKCQIDCTFNKRQNQHYLYQVKICFDKSFKPIDCSKSNKTYSNCSLKKKVLYLDSVPNNRGDL